MCTAITYYTNHSFFGRNLDYEHGFDEKVLITPRNSCIKLKNGLNIQTHHAIIGIGIEINNYPLYFDAMNEHGLGIAGLNFPDNAYYYDPFLYPDGIAPYELIPLLLSKNKTVNEAVEMLRSLKIINKPFSPELAISELHWMIADKNKSVVIEQTAQGLQIYDNPIGVLTNNPPFSYHIYNLSNYINITSQEATNRFAPNEAIQPYSRGMGGIGLPGDNSSASRFVRAAFTKLNSPIDLDKTASIVQFFRIMNSVYQVDGCTKVGKQYEKTIYTSCCSLDEGKYYYTTYNNLQINCVNMYEYDLYGTELESIDLIR